jgi:hypothetical protein
VKLLGMDPAEHYLWFGARLGLKPSPRFHLTPESDVPGACINPLLQDAKRCKLEGWNAASDSVLWRYVEQVLGTSGAPNGIDTGYVPKAQEQADFSRCPLRVIAFYLPQFHPIPENDEWWGKGFTEWTNVSRAVPQFLGHYQPHLPGELGFYDLRLVDVMRQQAALAKLYGIGGFCFHYYWFAGKRLLERPVDQFLEATDIDFPFCFCWANENWSRRWDGMEHEILIRQEHTPESDIAFIDDVIPAMRDPRYIRFIGRPVLVVYRVNLLPDAASTAARWRTRCLEAGVGDLYLVAACSFDITDPRPFGFDAAVEFPPHQFYADAGKVDSVVINPVFGGSVHSYRRMAESGIARANPDYRLLKTVCPGWDNEPRKPAAGHIFHGSSPEVYGQWLRRVGEATLRRPNRTATCLPSSSSMPGTNGPKAPTSNRTENTATPISTLRGPRCLAWLATLLSSPRRV